MLAKCRGNLVNGQQMTPQSGLWISITCSVIIMPQSKDED